MIPTTCRLHFREVITCWGRLIHFCLLCSITLTLDFFVSLMLGVQDGGGGGDLGALHAAARDGDARMVSYCNYKIKNNVLAMALR